MQEFIFPEDYKYNAIFMRWCIGYLEREEQIKFLQKAKKALNNQSEKYTRTKEPESCIIVFDNIDENQNRKERISKKG